MQNTKLEANLDRVKIFFKEEEFPFGHLWITFKHLSAESDSLHINAWHMYRAFKFYICRDCRILHKLVRHYCWVPSVGSHAIPRCAIWRGGTKMAMPVEGCPDPKDRIANAPDCSWCMWHCDVAECEIGSCRDCRHLEEDWEGWIRAEWDPQNTSQELTESCEARFWKDSGGYGWRPVWALHPV